jgi:signal transduction histidine kinase
MKADRVTPSSSIHKRQISLFTLLGGAILMAFCAIVGANLWSQYRLSNQIIDQEISNSVTQTHALFKTVLDGRLELISNTLTMVLLQEEATALTKRDSFDSIETRIKTLIDQQKQTIAADIMFLSNPQGTECRTSLKPWFSETIDCQALIQQFDSNLYDWHLAKLQTQKLPLLLLQTRAPLVADSGAVLGYFYAGIILNQNFSLLNQVINANPEQTVAIGITYENQMIASSATIDTPQHFALEQASTQPGKLFKFKHNDIVSMSKEVAFAHEEVNNLRLVSVIHTDVQIRLQRGMILQTSGILLLAITCIIFIVWLTLKLALTPLHRLRKLAAQRQSHGQSVFNSGLITEFQQLSHEVANMLTELQTNEQKLTEKTYLLQRSHNEQQHLIRRNRKLLHQLFNLQEQERKHLAQELHDELGQPLAVINTDSYLIKKSSTAGEQAYICADSIHQNAKEMSDVVYKRILSLRPMPLNDLGLFEAIRHMPALADLEKNGILVTTDLPSAPAELADHIAIHIFRIIQEGLTNILKHSQADRAWLRLQLLPPDLHPQRLILDIIDNGIGFDNQQLEQSPGYGLTGIVERVNAMNGTLELQRDSQQHFCIRISIDLSHQPLAPSFEELLGEAVSG